MKIKIFLIPVLVGLAIFGHSSTSLAGSPNEPPADLLEKMQQEGWKLVSPGVLQRGLGNNKVETIGFGAAGLRHKLEEMKTQYAFLREEYARQPSRDLRRTIRAHRAEILRTQVELEKTKETGEMESANEKVSAGLDCTIKYGAYVDAFHLTGGSPGVGANTNAYFNSNCGQIGEVYAYAHGKATRADNTVDTSTKSDPAPNTPRIGGNVTVSASVSVLGVRDCFSTSYATVTSYDMGVTYAQSVENRACPNPLSVSATSNSGGWVTLWGYACQWVTWTASATGGQAPYSYAWYRNNSYVGAGTSYSEQFCGPNNRSSYWVTMKATVADSSGQTASASETTTIDTYSNTSTCDPRFQVCDTCDPRVEFCRDTQID